MARALFEDPFFAAVDSKSLYDALGKLTSTSAYIADKRTAIDLSVIKHDLRRDGRCHQMD